MLKWDLVVDPGMTGLLDLDACDRDRVPRITGLLDLDAWDLVGVPGIIGLGEIGRAHV